MNARFEIWFLSDDRISILVETDQDGGSDEASIAAREFFEIITVAATTAGVIANLRNDLRIAFCSDLEACSMPASLEDVPSRLGNFVFVLHGVERGQRGFVGTVKMKSGGGIPVGRWKPRGFGLFSREVQDYSPTAAMALLLHVLGGLSQPGRDILVETAHTLGRLGLAGQIGMTNHSGIAMAVVIEAINDTAPTEETESASSVTGGDNSVGGSPVQEGSPEGGLLRDEDWSPLDGETCRVTAFRPLAGYVEGGEVKSSTIHLPYAEIDIEAPPLSGPTTGYISHKLDFLHLWQAFNDRGVADDEEVIVIWNKSNLRRGLGWSSRAMPGLIVWLCPKHAYEVMNDPSFRPELGGVERFEASTPIAKWVPEVFE